MKGLGRLQVAWALALLGGLSWGTMLGHGDGPALAGRLASSVVLVLAAAFAWRLSGHRLARWMLAGISFGTLGDFANAGLLPGGTLLAMAAFGIGHLCYVTGIVGALRERRTTLPASSVAVICWLIAGVLGWYGVVWLAPPHGQNGLVWPALAYTLLLSATAGFGTALALAAPVFRPLAVGAALFLLSDLVLAVELFRGRFPQDTLAVWIPYGVGQMLIVFTVARQVLRTSHLESP